MKVKCNYLKLPQQRSTNALTYCKEKERKTRDPYYVSSFLHL